MTECQAPFELAIDCMSLTFLRMQAGTPAGDALAAAVIDCYGERDELLEGAIAVALIALSELRSVLQENSYEPRNVSIFSVLRGVAEWSQA